MQYADQTLICNIKRVLCARADGHMAMVPGKSQPGDQIILFAGGAMPYVVRPMATITFSFASTIYMESWTGRHFPRMSKS
jgi:hypothetical protein